MSLAVGFSGILYGVNAFVLLASTYGKEYFLNCEISLKKNHQIRQMMLVITCLGIGWSFSPGISLIGHLSGFLAGVFLFFL